jgi:hypothetical protein
MSENKSSNGGALPPILFLLGLVAAYHFVLRPRMARWGTRDLEAERKLPGDDIITHPNLKMTHAIDIDAPSEVVWLWLAQMGRGGSGFYTFNSAPSADMIRTDLPELAVDMTLDNGWRVLRVEPYKHLVIGNFMLPTPLGSTYDVTHTYVLENLPDGGTRLLARLRIYSFELVGMLHNLVFEPIYFTQSLVQLNTLRERAESSKQYVVLSKEKANGRNVSTPA